MVNRCRRGIQALTPAPSAGGASGSSGQRARTGAARSSTMPRESRIGPAQAIIAALSVQSSGGGTTRRKICLRATALERGLQASIGGDAAGDHQHALRPLAGVPLDTASKPRAVRSATMSATASWKLAQRSATSCSLSGARASASCLSAVLRPASEKCGSLAAEHRPRQLDGRMPARGHALDLGSAGITEAQAAWPPCRRPRPARRRAWCRAAHSCPTSLTTSSWVCPPETSSRR